MGCVFYFIYTTKERDLRWGSEHGRDLDRVKMKKQVCCWDGICDKVGVWPR